MFRVFYFNVKDRCSGFHRWPSDKLSHSVQSGVSSHSSHYQLQRKNSIKELHLSEETFMMMHDFLF